MAQRGLYGHKGGINTHACIYLYIHSLPFTMSFSFYDVLAISTIVLRFQFVKRSMR